MKTNLATAFLLLLLCACKYGNASSLQNSEIAQDTIKSFTLPTPPDTMTAPEQRAKFVVAHYWDNVNFADTNYIHHPEVTEQAWADYCDILNHVPLEVAQEAIRATINRSAADKKVFTYITDLADKYLADPNSPMRNEEFYIPVLEAMINSSMLEDVEKIRPKALLKLAQKNRIGTQAINFTYTLASGAQASLHQLKANNIILFFNNPGCDACTETIASLKDTPIITQLLKEKALIILSIYPDEEVNEWRNHLNEFSSDWINAYDKKTTIQKKQLYDLKAMPTLYLLNNEKKVLLKDTTVPAIEEFLLLHQ